jgi:hypothetical protein
MSSAYDCITVTRSLSSKRKQLLMNEICCLAVAHFAPFVVGVWNLMRLFFSTSSRCVAIALKNRTNLCEIGMVA